MTNKNNSVLYTGVTSNLVRRVHKHKHGSMPGFTKKYKVTKLVYFEVSDSIYSAIEREKQIKSGSRQKKIDLVNTINPDWNDLGKDLLNQ